MRFDILTIFPEMFESINHSIIGRAKQNNILEINLINFRDYSNNKHKKVDDYPYGGGNGMVITPQPVYDAYKSITDSLSYKPRVIYMTPSGKTLNQNMVYNLSKEKHLIILCGHYEGIDQRLVDEIVTDEISIGDYVLTGGEIPAMVLIDSISRLIPEVLGNNLSHIEESFSSGLLEHPQYTRPAEWNGRKVPDILLSGHQKNINEYNEKQGLIKTYINRPDLLDNIALNNKQEELLNQYIKEIDKK